MKCKTRSMIVIICAAAVWILPSCGSSSVTLPVPAPDESLAARIDSSAAADDALAFIDEDFYLRDGFESHLPLLVLRDTQQVDIYPDGKLPDDEGMAEEEIFSGWITAEQIDVVEPLAYVDRDKAKRDKTDYTLRMPEAAQLSGAFSFFAAETKATWYLMGNGYDKSQLRNYLALTVADLLDCSSYQMRFCEVVQETADGYLYQGLYLLVASEAGTEHSLWRGYYGDGHFTALDTIGNRQYGLPGLYMKPDTITDMEMFHALQQDVNRMETAVFSADYNAFAQYDRYLKVENLRAYYIISELFGNYAGQNCMELRYDSETRLIWPAITMNFEFSADNLRDETMDLHESSMMAVEYYRTLSKHTTLLEQLQSTYRETYHKVISNGRMNQLIDESAVMLGAAAERNWERYRKLYEQDPKYRLVNDPVAENGDEEPAWEPAWERNSGTWEQEIHKLKYTFQEHTPYVYRGIESEYPRSEMVGKDAAYVRNNWMVFGAVILLIGSLAVSSRQLR